MTQEFVTLPREVVEQAIEALRGSETPTYRGQYDIEIDALVDLSAALDQPQNHVPDAGNMASAGWKLVPVEPTIHMLHRADGLTSIDFAALGREGAFDLDELKEIYRSMLAAAPQPPAVEQPRGEQEPVAWINYSTLTGERRLGLECESELASDPLYTKPQPPTDQQPYLWYDAERDRLWNQEDAKYMDMSGTIPLYTHPQPKREPLTDEQVMQAVRHLYQSDFAAGMGFPDDLDVARAIEAAHNIKEKQ